MKKLVKESLNESSKTIDEFMDEISDVMEDRGVARASAQDALEYWYSKGYVEDLWQEGFSPEEAYQDLKTYPYFT